MKETKRNHIFLKSLMSIALGFILTSCGKHNLDVDEGLLNIPTLSVSSSMQDGKFSSPPEFELILSKSEESSNISYCVNAGVDNAKNCCDPKSGGIITAGAKVNATAGSTDGYYCLAYFGYTDSEYSSVEKVLFEIDSSGPELNITTPQRMVQSSEYLDISFTSEDIGYQGIFFSALNYPNLQGTDCDAINSDANLASNGIDFNKDSTPDTIDMTGIYTNYSETLRGKDLMQYGSNYIYFALVDTKMDPMKSTCPGVNIILRDFDVFEFSSNGDVVPNAQGEMEVMGTFSSFGGGSFTGSDNSSKLEIGLVNIIH